MDLISPYFYGHAGERVDLIVTLKHGRKVFIGNYKVLFFSSLLNQKQENESYACFLSEPEWPTGYKRNCKVNGRPEAIAQEVLSGTFSV